MNILDRPAFQSDKKPQYAIDDEATFNRMNLQLPRQSSDWKETSLSNRSKGGCLLTPSEAGDGGNGN